MKEYDAPRLKAYLPKGLGRPVMVVDRSEWDRLGLKPDTQVLVDIDQTPLTIISSQATVLATVAHQYSTSSGRLTVYREDRADAPKTVNTDHYEVWTDLRSHRSFDQMVIAASTGMNDNMRGYLDEHVFLVKEPPGDDHRLEDLPRTVSALFTRPSSSSAQSSF